MTTVLVGVESALHESAAVLAGEPTARTWLSAISRARLAALWIVNDCAEIGCAVDFAAAVVSSAVPECEGDNQMKKLNKTSSLKLTLGRETVRRLSATELELANGGFVTGKSNVFLQQCPSAGCGPVLQ